jgi:Protein of unknown function (DUF5131)
VNQYECGARNGRHDNRMDRCNVGTQLRAVPSSLLAAPTATPCAWPRVWMPWDKRNIRGSRDGAVAGPSGPARYELTKTLWLFLRRGQNHEKCSSIQCRIYSTKLPAGFIRRVWDVMGGTPRHTYQILTKRPDRMCQAMAQDFCQTYGSERPLRMDEYLIGSTISERCRPRSVLFPLNHSSAPLREAISEVSTGR